jgi:heat shock protein HslJ
MHLPRRRPAALLLALVLGTTLLPGTAAGQGVPDPDAVGVEGPKWQLLEYRDGDRLTLVPPGIGADLIFWADVLVGTSACGELSSSYRLAPGVLRIAPPEVRARQCDAESQAIDEIFFRHLADTTDQSIDGSVMEFDDATGNALLTFTRAEVPDDPTIAPWRLARVTEPDGSVGPVVAGSDPSATFLPGGRVVGRTGCGAFLGSYDTNDTRLAIRDLAFRFESCTPDVRAQAELITETLVDVTDFAVTPAGMALADASGVTRLAWVPSIPLTGRNWTPVAVLDPDGEVALPSERLASVSLRFSGNGVDGRTMCRAYSGRNLRSGLALTIFDAAPAKGYCKPKNAERTYLGALGQVAAHALRGSQLELLDKDGQPLVRLVAQPDLQGVRWELTRLDWAPGRGRGDMREPVEGVPLPSATFINGENVLQGETGANAYNALYEAAGSTISIRDPRSSTQDCRTARRQGRPICRQEAFFLQRLTEANGYIVQSDRLRLLRGNRVILEFRPAQPESAADTAA